MNEYEKPTLRRLDPATPADAASIAKFESSQLLVGGQPIAAVGRGALIAEIFRLRKAMVAMEEFSRKQQREIDHRSRKMEALLESLRHLPDPILRDIRSRLEAILT